MPEYMGKKLILFFILLLPLIVAQSAEPHFQKQNGKVIISYWPNPVQFTSNLSFTIPLDKNYVQPKRVTISGPVLKELGCKKIESYKYRCMVYPPQSGEYVIKLYNSNNKAVDEALHIMLKEDGSLSAVLRVKKNNMPLLIAALSLLGVAVLVGISLYLYSKVKVKLRAGKAERRIVEIKKELDALPKRFIKGEIPSELEYRKIETALNKELIELEAYVKQNKK